MTKPIVRPRWALSINRSAVTVIYKLRLIAVTSCTVPSCMKQEHLQTKAVATYLESNLDEITIRLAVNAKAQTKTVQTRRLTEGSHGIVEVRVHTRNEL